MEQWSCGGGKSSWDGHPLVYLPKGQACPYCGKKQ